MKYTTALAFFLSLLALVSSALIAREAEPVDALAKDPSDKPTFVPSTLPDGRRRITLFENGAFAGSITEGTAGSGENYTYVDPSNNAISATKFLTAETVQAQGASDGLRFPWPPISPLLKLLRRFAGLITKWGRRFFNFLVCVGGEVGLECADEILGCAESGTPPWLCLEGIVCGGKAFKHCV